MSNRSGSPYSAPRDANRVPFLLAASTTDGITPVVLEADPTTHLLQVSSSSSVALKPTTYDTMTYTSNTTSDVYVYTLAGVTKATQTVNYTDSTKAVITTVVWS